MKYVDEFRDIELVRNLAAGIRKLTTREWTIMEICGGQTHSIMRYNLEEFLPEKIQLVHGPGCPVCVTPLEIIDKAIHIAQMEDVIFRKIPIKISCSLPLALKQRPRQMPWLLARQAAGD